MNLSDPAAIAVNDPSKVGEARRTAAALAAGMGFNEVERGHVGIVVTEVATNLLKHAVGGELQLQRLEVGRARGLEILALDRGPGIADVNRCLVDGYSTAGSLGHGLGAIMRLTSTLDIDSVPGKGTVLLARLWAGAAPEPGETTNLEWGVVHRPMPGEEVCGDAWAMADDGDQTLLVVVDGLGHGPQAAAASHVAIQVFRSELTRGPVAILQASHAALRSTRGAAMAVALLDPHRREVRYCGVGNIAGAIVKPGDDRTQSMVSHNGTVGHTVRRLQEFTYPWDEGAPVIMSSDGLTSHWQLGRYPGLAAKHPGLLAGVLYRDAARERDDVTVLVVRERSEYDR